MKKSTTWRVRAIGRSGAAFDRSFDEEDEATGFILTMRAGLRDYQFARLETIVSGPNGLASVSNAKATYYRTIIDTREWITREWSDPASAKRWEELSEKE